MPYPSVLCTLALTRTDLGLLLSLLDSKGKAADMAYIPTDNPSDTTGGESWH